MDSKEKMYFFQEQFEKQGSLRGRLIILTGLGMSAERRNILSQLSKAMRQVFFQAHWKALSRPRSSTESGYITYGFALATDPYDDSFRYFIDVVKEFLKMEGDILDYSRRVLLPSSYKMLGEVIGSVYFTTEELRELLQTKGLTCPQLSEAGQEGGVSFTLNDLYLQMEKQIFFLESHGKPSARLRLDAVNELMGSPYPP